MLTNTHSIDINREVNSIYIEKVISIINQSVSILWMITSKMLSEKSKKEQYSTPNNNNKAATSTDTIKKLINIL